MVPLATSPFAEPKNDWAIAVSSTAPEWDHGETQKDRNTLVQSGDA